MPKIILQIIFKIFEKNSVKKLSFLWHPSGDNAIDWESPKIRPVNLVYCAENEKNMRFHMRQNSACSTSKHMFSTGFWS